MPEFNAQTILTRIVDRQLAKFEPGADIVKDFKDMFSLHGNFESVPEWQQELDEPSDEQKLATVIDRLVRRDLEESKPRILSTLLARLKQFGYEVASDR
jgi:hypothetical protein